MTKITICAIAKNEDKYIEDWLKYHYELGFTNITVYDNNVPERRGELQQLINDSDKLTDEMKVATEIIDATGKNGFQQSAYNEYYKTHDFDWCAYIDIDEYIKLVAWDNIDDMLNDERFDNASVIHLVWKTISDDDIVDVPDDFIYNGKQAKYITDEEEREAAASEWEKIPVYDRLFKETRKFGKFVNKQIIRGGIDDIIINLHYYTSQRNRRTYFASGKPRKYVPDYWIFSENDYNNDINYAYINHYRTKTIREFLRQKYLNQSDADHYSTRTLFVCDYFFKINNITKEKVEYYKKHHKPIVCNIVINEKDYDKVQNMCDLCYICNQKKKYNNPFVIDYNFLQEHIDYIDIFNII